MLSLFLAVARLKALQDSLNPFDTGLARQINALQKHWRLHLKPSARMLGFQQTKYLPL